MSKERLKDAAAQFILSSWVASLCEEGLVSYVPEFLKKEGGYSDGESICFEASESLAATLIFVDSRDSGVMCLLPGALFVVAKQVLDRIAVTRNGLYMYYRMAKVKVCIRYDIHPMVLQAYLHQMAGGVTSATSEPAEIDIDPFGSDADVPSQALQSAAQLSTVGGASVMIGGYYSQHEDAINDVVLDDESELSFSEEVDLVSKKSGRTNFEYIALDDYFVAPLRRA